MTSGKKYKNPVDYEIFSLLRRRFKLAIESDYEDYIKSVQENIHTDTKYFWSFISSKKKNSNLPLVMNLNENSASNVNDICELFNNYF